MAFNLRLLRFQAVDALTFTWKIMNPSSESRNGQRLYVGIIATSTILLLGLFLWPLSVQQFRTTAQFKLKYQADSGVEKTMLNSWVVEALREETDRIAIADMLEQMDCVLTSTVLNSLDPETIREALHVQGRPGATANSVEYRLSMVGEGTEDEIEFINLIIARINNHLERQLTRSNNSEVVVSLTKDFVDFHETRIMQLSGQLTGVLAQLSTAENDIRIISSDLESLLNGMPSKTNFTRPTSQQLEELEQKKKELLQQPGYNEYHPEVTAIRQQLEALDVRNQQSNQVPAKTAELSQSTDDTKFVPNQFFNSSQKKVPAEKVPSSNVNDGLYRTTMNQILDDIETVDLSTSRRTLSAVQNSLDQENGMELLVDRFRKRALQQLDYESPVALADLSLAKRSSPMGGAPTPSQFLCLFLFAGVFGTIVASNYDPSVRVRPFRSVDQLQRKLNLPVVGVLRNASAITHRPLNKILASRMIQICEWTLLALAILLIIAALANSELAVAFIENPFHGITETIWLISPKK